MKTPSELLSQKQQLIERLQERIDPEERDEIERLLEKVDAALDSLEKAGSDESAR
jgi:chaperonin cofactor prefoldin